MQQLLDEIKRIHDAKARAHIVPDYAIRREVHIDGMTMDEMDAYAKELERENLIRIGQTLNDIYYELKQA